MKRILIIHNEYQDPGGEDLVFQQETALLSETVIVETLRFRNKSGFKGFIQFALYPWNLFSWARIQTKIKEFNPDLVHIHNIHYAIGPLALRELHNKGIPTVMTLHNYRLLCPSATLFYRGGIYTESLNADFPWRAIRQGVHQGSMIKTFWIAWTHWFHKRIGTWKRVGRFFVLTPFAKDLLNKSTLNLAPNKIIVKPNFVASSSEMMSSQRRERHFLYVGRLTQEKGINVLLEAFKQSKAVIKIAGDGPMKDEVRHFQNQYPNIQYLGSLTQEEVTRELQSCTALIFPSIWYEGMPMTILQAFATGTAIIASRLGAMGAMIQEGREGLLYEPGNALDLQNSLQIWTKLSLSKKAAFGRRARQTYDDHFQPSHNREHILNHYQELLSEYT